MHNVLIVSALSQELSVIKDKVKQTKIANLKIDFLQTGMGNYNSIFSLTKELERKRYDFVLNIGICGFRGKNMKENVFQIANIVEIFSKKELIVPITFKFSTLATCLSSNKIIKDIDFKDKKIKFLDNDLVNLGVFFNDFYILDMESFGLEYVLEKYNIPRLFLKTVVDKNLDELERIDYEKALNNLSLAIDYENLLIKVRNYLNLNRKENIDLNKYFKQLAFSVRQKEIFEFLYRKYKFVIGGDFDEFFNQFLEINKNEKNKKRLAGKLIEEMRRLFGNEK